MKIIEIVIGFLTSTFMITGLFSIGSFFNKFLPNTDYKVHIKIGLGFAFIQLFFISISLIGSNVLTNISCLALITASLFYHRNQIRFLLKSFFKTITSSQIFLLIIFIPFLFRLMSPPTSYDGLNFYLPSVEWVFHNGLAFNPYLTGYTTMPMGGEYLFSLSYGLGQYSGVRWTDAFFTFLLISLIYSFSKTLMSKNIAKLSVLLCISIESTFFWVFGTGKVDTISTYIMLLGFALLIENWERKNFSLSFVMFCISLSIKYTNWILLILPITLLFLYLIKQKFTLKRILFALIPLLFVIPTVLKNKIQTNNPLAPLIEVSGQSEHVKQHGSLPNKTIIEGNIYNLDKDKKEKIISSKSFQLVFFISACILLIAIIIYLLSKSTFDIKPWFVFFIASLLPWVYFLGYSNQPLRFVWLLLILGILIVTKFLDIALLNFKKISHVFSVLLLSLTFITLTHTVYSKYGEKIKGFWSYQKSDLIEWYEKQGLMKYAFSYQLKQKDFQHKDVFYYNAPTLGAFRLNEYGNLPTDYVLYQNNTSSQTLPTNKSFIVINQKTLLKRQLDTTNILFRKGDYFLIKQ